MRFNNDTLDKIYSLTKKDVKTLFLEYTDFVATDYKNIWDYYRGKMKQPIMSSFDRLNKLQEEFDETVGLIGSLSQSFGTTDFWEVLDIIEDIRLNLKTVENSSKWSRSSIVKNNFYNQTQVQYVQQANQTLEEIALLSGEFDFGNAWVPLAIKNDAREEDYTSDGGYNIFTSVSLFNSFTLNSVVDNLYGQRVYGKDFDQTLTFEDDDLKVLDYSDTLEQTVNILMNLGKGDDPFNPRLGIKKSYIVGGNRGSLSFPIIFRQMLEVFSTDDSLASFKLLDLRIESDSVILQISVKTRLSDLVSKNVVL